MLTSAAWKVLNMLKRLYNLKGIFRAGGGGWSCSITKFSDFSPGFLKNVVLVNREYIDFYVNNLVWNPFLSTNCAKIYGRPGDFSGYIDR